MTRLFLMLSLISALCLAQERTTEDIHVEVPKPPPEKEDQGWHLKLVLGAISDWDFDHNYENISDGHYLTLGAKLAAEAFLFEGPHTWRNELSLKETFRKTPPIGAFLKSVDSFVVDSTYLYELVPSWGVFGRLYTEAPAFNSYDIRANVVNYRIKALDGTERTVTADELLLSSSFVPFHLRQSLGAFILPVKEKAVQLELKAAWSFREVFANGLLKVRKAGTKDVVVDTLADFFQIGPSLDARLEGDLIENRLHYKLTAEAMYVVYRASIIDFGANFSDRVNAEGKAELTFKFVDWATLMWDFRVLRFPELSPEPQLQSNLMLALEYTL